MTPRPPPPAASPPWHALPVPDVVARLESDADRGLAPQEARRRLARLGANRVGEHPETPLWRMFLAQFRSLVVLLLLAAAVIAWLLRERAEGVAILAALVLNAVIGFGSEWRARTSLGRLRSLAVPSALARRGGRIAQLPSADLVPGDLVVLEAGAQVPADARLIQSAALRVAEAALTGESAAVDKDAAARVDREAPLAERRTMVYLGTAVVAGHGLAVVTATGIATELGRIGQLVALTGERATPLEREVEWLGRRLVVLALAICALVGLAGILHGEPMALMLETAISLAVAAMPEGLPAVTSVALAAGLWRLARRGALVRRLPAVETLGSTSVICADKTGTMTENQMTVMRLALDGRVIAVGGGGRSPAGALEEGGAALDPRDPGVRLLLTAGALVNDASVTVDAEGVTAQGDPTESALLVAALKAGLDPAGLAAEWPRLGEIPFDPARRIMATFHRSPDGGSVAFVKGAPAAVLDLCAFRHTPAGVVALRAADRERLLAGNRALAAMGLRVLGVGWRPLDSANDARLDGLTWLGLVGMADPLRPGVKEAIAAAAGAGIRTIMLTGDQRDTALAVGRALGLGPEAIRSRMSPEGKVDLIEELERQGHIVAMTGDGVNDAPALARADIGVAMGRHGTDVAREAADLVLTDDDFTTIVHAVEEGRVIRANLRKVIRFLFSCNLSEIITIFAAILLGLPAPLLPLQILWVNLVTDILPAMALVRDPADPAIMREPPRDPGEALVTWRFAARMLAEGSLLAAGVLSAYLWVVWQAGPGRRATTMAFMALVLIHPFQAINCRSERVGWWRLPANRLTWAALAALVGLQWLSLEFKPLARLLDTVPLGGADWVALGAGVVWPVLLMEVSKGWGGASPAWRSRHGERAGPSAGAGSTSRNR